MFKTMRGYLKGRIENDLITLKIREKLQKFLDENPDVDHYMSDTNKITNGANFWLGVFLASLLTVLACLIIFVVALHIWHLQGWANIPGWTVP